MSSLDILQDAHTGFWHIRQSIHTDPDRQEQAQRSFEQISKQFKRLLNQDRKQQTVKQDLTPTTKTRLSNCSIRQTLSNPSKHTDFSLLL